MATIIQRSDEAHIGLLQAKTEKEMFKRLYFSRWMGFTQQSKMTGEDIPPVAPIVMKKDFASQGMDNMVVPMLKNLSGRPVYGDTQVLNTGESQRLNYLKIYLNQRRKAVQPPARMSNQRVKTLNLIEQARPQMQDWLARDTEVQIVRAFYERYSGNVSTATSSGGLGQTIRYHPNIYAADSGAVTWSGTVATHVSNIHTANQGLLAGAADDKMSASALYKFMTYCNKKEIVPIVIDGYDIRPLLIHENQWAQLLLDPLFRETMNQALPRTLIENPLLSGCSHIFAKFAIFVREFSVFGLSSTSSALTWGATYPLEGVDSYDTKGAICFGMGALAGAWAFGPEYSVEVTDHKNKQETAVAMIDGFARADYMDDSTTPTEVINKSSALLLTYSPDSVI